MFAYTTHRQELDMLLRDANRLQERISTTKNRQMQVELIARLKKLTEIIGELHEQDQDQTR